MLSDERQVIMHMSEAPGKQPRQNSKSGFLNQSKEQTGFF